MRKLNNVPALVFALALFISTSTTTGKTALVLSATDGSGLGPAAIEQLLSQLALDITVNLPTSVFPDFDLVVLDGNVCDTGTATQIRDYLQTGGTLLLTGETPRRLTGSNDLTTVADIMGAQTCGAAPENTAIIDGDNPYCLPYRSNDTLGSAATAVRPGLSNPTETLQNTVRWSDNALFSYALHAYNGNLLYLADTLGEPTLEFARAALSEMLQLGQLGDVDGSQDLNITDAVYLIQYIFAGGDKPRPFTNNGDVNCDRVVDISDAVYLINYVFQGGPSPCVRCYKGAVYVVVAMDTEPMVTTGPTLYHLGADLSNFARTGGNAYVNQVMNPAFRNQFTDSFGGHLKFSFFCEASEYYCHSTVLDCNGVYGAMEKFLPDIATYGDELGWHYHSSEWAQANWDTTQYYWSQIITFNGTQYFDDTDVGSAEKTLNHLLIDKGFFPTTFRSGWVWENNDYSNWLDGVIPFDFSNLSPLASFPPGSSIFWDYYDWKRAPRGWVFYHPSHSDYQSAGQLKRFIFRSNYVDSNDPESGLPTDQLENAFQRAAQGDNVYVSVYGHTFYPLTTFFEPQWYSDLQSLSTQYDTPFEFATSKEAARAVLGYQSDTTAPVITLTREADSLVISVDKTIFQATPYCALKQGDIYTRLYPTRFNQRIWKLGLAGLSGFTIGVGVCDYAGNAAVAKYQE